MPDSAVRKVAYGASLGEPHLPRERVGNLDQVVLARSDDAIDIRVFGGLDIRLHPRRGFDIGAAWYRGIPISWISPAGEGGRDRREWRDAWGGGLVTTCGLDNVGEPSEECGLHGSFTFLPATDISVEVEAERVRCSAVIEDPRGLRVVRTVETAVGRGRLELRDRITNHSDRPLESPLLYHVNIGWPLWDRGTRVTTNATEVVPRDADAAQGDPSVGPEPVAEREGVWEHLEATHGIIENEGLGVRLRVASTLPRLWQWIDPTPYFYALALEPANCSVRGRAYDRATGSLPILAIGASMDSSLWITVDEAGGRT